MFSSRDPAAFEAPLLLPLPRSRVGAMADRTPAPSSSASAPGTAAPKPIASSTAAASAPAAASASSTAAASASGPGLAAAALSHPAPEPADPQLRKRLKREVMQKMLGHYRKQAAAKAKAEQLQGQTFEVMSSEDEAPASAPTVSDDEALGAALAAAAKATPASASTAVSASAAVAGTSTPACLNR